MAGWAHPPGLLRCGGPLHLLGAHSLGLLSRLLEKESTEVKLCTDTGIGGALKPLAHSKAGPTLAYILKPHTCICPHRHEIPLLLCSPFYQKSPRNRSRGTSSGKGRLSASRPSQPHANLMLLQFLNVSGHFLLSQILIRSVSLSRHLLIPPCKQKRSLVFHK